MTHWTEVVDHLSDIRHADQEPDEILCNSHGPFKADAVTCLLEHIDMVLDENSLHISPSQICRLFNDLLRIDRDPEPEDQTKFEELEKVGFFLNALELTHWPRERAKQQALSWMSPPFQMTGDQGAVRQA